MKSPVNKTRLAAVAIGLLLTVFAAAVQLGEAPLLDDLEERLELLSYDLRMKGLLRAAPQPHPQVVIVDIDEASLSRIGRFPWPRDTLAALVERLADAGAYVVAFDILFAEPEANVAETLAKALDPDDPEQARLRDAALALAPRFDRDARLAGALGATDVVLGYSIQPTRGDSTGVLPPAVPVSDATLIPRLSMQPKYSYSGNLEALQAAAVGGGFFTPHVDPDGNVRRVPVVARYGDQLFGSLALEAVRLFRLIDQVDLLTGTIAGAEALEGIRISKAVLRPGADGELEVVKPEVVVPTDGQGNALVPYRGPAYSFRYLPAHRVLAGELEAGSLQETIVLIGTTAPGLFDLRATPVDSIYPGVEVHANLIAAMLDNRFLYVPPWAVGADLAVLAAAGLILALLLPRLSPVPQLLTSAAAATAVVGFNVWLWAGHGLVLSLASPLVLVGLLAGFNLAWGFLFEANAKRRLKGMFGQYVPPQLVEEMSNNPDGEYGFEGDTREMTVLFADIRGFTTLSEKLAANDLKRLLNRYFTPMTKIIFDTRGTIDKYVGDMIMAFWGAPLPDAEHAIHAIRAALAMQAESRRLSERFLVEGLPPVAIGVGINTGVMNVGDMGSEYRRAYTVLGDSVNLASRLEAASKDYGAGIVVGEATHALAADRFVFRELDLVRVKGKAQAVRIFEPLAAAEEAGPELLEELERHAAGLAAYRGRRWEEADAMFADLERRQPQTKLYALYRERIGRLRTQTLPADWDGAFDRTSK